VIEVGIALSSLLAALMRDKEEPHPRELERAAMYAMLQSIPARRYPHVTYLMRRDTEPYVGMSGAQKANWAMGQMVCPVGHKGEFTIYSLAIEQALSFSRLVVEGDDSSHPGVRVAASTSHEGDSWRTVDDSDSMRLFQCHHASHRDPSDRTQGFFMLPRKLVKSIEWMDQYELERFSKGEER
jgi:hypothetical protein